MGNRAVIEFESKGIGIYLHHDGGRDSVEAFLEVAKEYKAHDGSDYTIARLTQIIGNYIGGILSLGIGPIQYLDRDNYDNGVYVINDSLDIIDRYYNRNPEQYFQDKEQLKEDIRAANDQFFTGANLS